MTCFFEKSICVSPLKEGGGDVETGVLCINLNLDRVVC